MRPQSAGAARGPAGSICGKTQRELFDPRIPRPDVVVILARAAFERGLGLREAFKDGYRFRHGVCTPSAMKTALTVLGIELRDYELQELLDRFSQDGLFRYLDFCAAWEETTKSVAQVRQEVSIQDIWTPRETVQKSAAVSPAAPVAVDLSDDATTQAENESDQAQASPERSILDRLHETVAYNVKSRSLDILGAFDNLARARWAKPGHVTVSQFFRAMHSLGLALAQPDLSVLCSAYCDTELGNEFNYVDFCSLVDPRTVSAQASKAVRQVIQKLHVEKCQIQSPHNNPYFDRRGKVRPYVGPRPVRTRGIPQPPKARPLTMSG